MNNMFRFVLLSSALAMLGVSGCDSDAGAEKVGNPCTDECTPDEKKCDSDAVYVCEKSEDTEEACYEWIKKETCSDGKHCDGKKFECVAAEECTEFCDEDSTIRCTIKGLEECTPDKKGCASWSVVDPCEGGACDPDTLECVEGEEPCPNSCDPDKESKRCDGEDIYVCQKNEDSVFGCYTWVHEKSCDNGQHCDETTFECVEGCTEVCEESHSTRCSGNELEQCISDESGCASWSVIDTCEGGTCDPEKLKCVNACNDECTVDEKKCEGNGTVSCIKDGDGCLQWGEPEPCGENKNCDSQTIECTEVCNSNCTEKDKKETHATSQKVCTDVDGKGCLQWVETKCSKGEKFDAKQNKCVSVCGDDCEPFTIVFLPDTQKYTRRLKKDSKGNIVKMNNELDIFPDQLKWIQDYKDKYNIKAVIHLGDITDRNAQIAWQHASNSYAKYIDVMDLPYTVAPGNHDYLQCKSNDVGDISKNCKGSNGSPYSRTASKFDDKKSGNFNNSRAKLKDRKWFKGFKDVGNSYITFKAANIDFLVVALEFMPRKEVIDWANNVIKDHPNHKVIIESHAYLYPHKHNQCTSKPKMNASGQFTDSYSEIKDSYLKGFGKTSKGGDYMFEHLVAKHNNIILVVNGHHTGSCFRLNKGNNGNTVAEMIVDYQGENGVAGTCESTVANGGAGTGWFRMLKFDPKNYTITATSTSSLTSKQFKKDKKEWFYCKKYYPQNPKERPTDKNGKEYRININNDNQRYTNKHAFVVDFDFVTPVDYMKK